MNIILFDGICNYCNKWVDFYIRHDKGAKLKFAALQSDAGKKLLEQHGINAEQLNSVVFIENGKAFVKSTAGLRSFRYLDGIYPLFAWCLVFPRPLRDWCYDLIARNRYNLQGKLSQCRVPDEKIKSRFIS